MSDRDRLIELLLQSDPIKERDLDDEWFDGETEDIADHLLANGVIVLPLPIGSTVYEIRARGKRKHNGRKFDYAISTKLMFRNAIYSGEELYVKEKKFTKTDKVRWNKSVFLTKEEAEKALAERSVDNGTVY